jgi:cytochrome c6
MNHVVRTVGAALVAAMLTGSVGFAQSSTEALYKAKCQMCHGEKGMADSGPGKAMKVKPVSDPDVKKMNEAQMIEAVKNGMGKMQPYKDKLTDAQVKDVVGYFRTFLK